MKTWHFVLQWHVTARCDQRCDHCYMHDEPTYAEELRHPLTTGECERVMDGLVAMVARLSSEHGVDIRPRINFTGGDPLLRRDLFDLLRAAQEREIFIGILGNPYHLTEEVAQRLRRRGVRRYQVSIDGLEETHDALRRPGSFAASLRALTVLKSEGIPECVMFTLSKRTAGDLIPLMRLMAESEVTRFDFARMAACGSAKNIDGAFSPKEYRALLLEVREEIERLRRAGAVTHFGYKDHLWTLLRYELDELDIAAEPGGKKIRGGCTAGLTFLVLLADGTIYACRRFPSRIGNVRTDDLYEVFRTSPVLALLRDVEQFEKCRQCELRQYCRGCPAVAACENDGSFLSPDPQCWKELPSLEAPVMSSHSPATVRVAHRP